jgi:hypothetical protein
VNFVDYSPPHSPSLDQQQDALQKGLGRALLWALGGCLNDKPLLEACLRDQRFDGQVEGPRGGWLWQMIETVGAWERFRVPILHALYELADDRSENQLCQLAQRYAEAGDETFRTRLYEIVEQKPVADIPWLGEEEIVTLDGEQAFLFAARVRGMSLAGRKWEWDDDWLTDLAVERFGEEQVRRLMESSSDDAVKRFRDHWQENKHTQAGQGQHGSHRERLAATPVDEVLRAAEGGSKCFWLRGWGINADKPALLTILQRLWSVSDPKVLANLLRVFSARALTEFDPRLIELCRHCDEEVRRRAFQALEQNAHPLIRQFALTELRKGMRDGSVIALFINNYRQGDEQRILEAMEFPDDECELHWLLLDAIKVLEKNPEADCSRLGVITYASTPCETCRFYAAQILLNQQVAPEWLNEECRHDSSEDCRAFAAKATGSTRAG